MSDKLIILVLVCVIINIYSFITPIRNNLLRNKKSLSLHKKIISEWLQGSYNNKIQADKDLANGKPTAKVGGHELVYADIISGEKDNIFVATYYLNSTDTIPFRLRYYELLNSSNESYDCIMKLYKPNTDLLTKIRSGYSYKNNFTIIDFDQVMDADIGWKKIVPSDDTDIRSYYLGVLVNGECKVRSEVDSNMIITVRDELRLYRDELWINDRVYSSEGQLLIGNTLNIPYKLQKMSR